MSLSRFRVTFSFLFGTTFSRKRPSRAPWSFCSFRTAPFSILSSSFLVICVFFFFAMCNCGRYKDRNSFLQVPSLLQSRVRSSRSRVTVNAIAELNSAKYFIGAKRAPNSQWPEAKSQRPNSLQSSSPHSNRLLLSQVPFDRRMYKVDQRSAQDRDHEFVSVCGQYQRRRHRE